MRAGHIILVAWLLTGGQVFAAAPGLEVVPGRVVTLEDFQTRGTRDDGSRWELYGKHAEVAGALANIRDVRLTFYFADGKTAVVTSPRCDFDQAAGTGASDAPIHVVSQTLRLDGVGYDLLLDKQVIHIRSAVEMRLRREGRGADPADLLRWRPRAAPDADKGKAGNLAAPAPVSDNPDTKRPTGGAPAAKEQGK
jgi:hypothetical protein